MCDQQAASEPKAFLYRGGEIAEVFRDKIYHLRIDPRVKVIPNDTFAHCVNLTEVTFSEGLQIIGGSAFARCTALQRVTLPSTITELGDDAFFGCDKLVEMQMNEGLKVIGTSAFVECTALQNVTIPSTVTKLGGWAFQGCNNLVGLQLNEGLQTIGCCAFLDCTALQIINLPLTVTEIGRLAFCGCSDLVVVKLNEGLQSIGVESFRGCSNLVEVQFKGGLQIIGDHAFEGCKALRCVTLPSTVTELGEAAFRYCSSLIELRLTEGLQTIGDYAFQLCTGLRSVIIPSTAELGVWAFYDCRNLSEVIFLDGKRLLNRDFLACGFHREEQELLNQEELDEILFDEDRDFAFESCPVSTVKISISWESSERMARLPPECRLSVEEIIRNLPRLQLLEDGKVVACFPLVIREPGDEAEDDSDSEAEDEDTLEVQDTNLETARSLYQVLQLIAFHELKESSILIELAMWKSRIDGSTSVPRADCRVTIPDPAKNSIMEYCGFAGPLKPAIEGSYG